jgi:hypothetical protein
MATSQTATPARTAWPRSGKSSSGCQPSCEPGSWIGHGLADQQEQAQKGDDRNLLGDGTKVKGKEMGKWYLGIISWPPATEKEDTRGSRRSRNIEWEWKQKLRNVNGLEV